MINIDGIEWNIPCKITREAEMKASEISGMLLNRRYFNDVLGTFMKYEVQIEIPYWMENRYADIYEILSKPVDGHVFVLPYNNGQINITGRVEVVSDVYVEKPNGKGKWRNTKFTVIANHPSKTMSLLEVVTAGLTPLPEVPSASIGDLYEYTPGGWVERFYEDGDSIGY